MNLKKLATLFLVGTAATLAAYEFESLFKQTGGFTIPCGEKDVSETVECTLPALPADKRAILRFKAYLADGGGGWNNTLRLTVNGKLLRRKMDSGEERLLRRGLFMESETRNPKRSWWSGSGLLVFFGDGKELEKRIKFPREEGYTYLLDISDVIRTGKNSIGFINGFRVPKDDKNHRKTALKVEDLEVGFLSDLATNTMRPGLSRKVPDAPYWHKNKEFIPFFAHPGATFPVDAEKKQLDVTFPAVPKKNGYTVVMGYRGWIGVPAPGGWNYHTGLLLNDGKLDKMTAIGEPRLLRRGSHMDTSLPKNPLRDWWKEGQLVTFFGNGRDPDSRLNSGKEEGYNFLFDISDRVNYVEIGADNRVERARDNRLSLISAFSGRRKEGALANAPSVFEDIVIGYVPNASLEKMRPAEEDSSMNLVSGTKLFSVEKKGYALDFWKGGGFTVKCAGAEYYVQDSFSFPGKGAMDFSTFALADPENPPTVKRNGDSVTITACNAFFKIERIVTLFDGQFHVTDTITNISGKDQGMRTRFVTTSKTPLRASQTYISGLPDKHFLDGMCGQNPTFFTQGTAGGSLGIYVYDDLLRNQSGFLRTRRDLILDNGHLGFPASGRQAVKTLVRRFYPMPGGTYFDFVNRIRRDLNLNRLMSGLFGFVSKPMTVPSIKHYALTQWFEWDANSRWSSREDYKQRRRKESALIKKMIPGAKCIGRMESNILNIKRASLPGGEKLPDGRRGKGGGVYGLELTEEQNAILRNSPFSDSLMRNAKGHAVVDTGYAHPGDLNLLVHFAEGNYRLKHVLEQIDYILDDVGLDGVYLDQFVPGCDQELDNNKRCSYDKWDQCTVDLNPDGTIRRRIYDYITAGSSARAKIVRHVAAKGGLMYNNNHPVTLETNGLPSYSFCETGGPGTEMEVKHGSKPALLRCHALAQLSGSPISLGYQEPTPKELSGKIYNRAVIIGLRHGILYAQYGVIPDPKFGGSFATDYMYPITPVELGEGFIIGKERIISCVSRKFTVKSERKPLVLWGDEFGRKKENPPEPVRETGGWEIDLKLKDWNEVAVILLNETK